MSIYLEGGETLKQFAQRSCGYSISGGVYGWDGWDPWQSDSVGGNTAHGRKVGTR